MKPKLPDLIRRSKVLKIYMSALDYADVLELVSKTNLTVSEFGRRSMLGQRIVNHESHQLFIQMLSLRQDLKRICDLLRKIPFNNSQSFISSVVHRADRMLKEFSERLEVAGS